MTRALKPAKKRIGSAFVADPPTRTMPANETDIVTQRQNFGLDGLHQCGMVATGQVRPANGPMKKNITEMGNVLGPVNENNMACRMARRMVDLKLMRAEADPVAVIKPAIRSAIAHVAVNAVEFRLRFDIVQQGLVVTVRPNNFDPKHFFQLHCTTRMIQMSVCQPDRGNTDTVFLQDLEDDLNIAAGVHHHTVMRVRVEKDRAILFKRSDRNNPGLKHAHL
ncbi:MAG: hypothetical protein RIR97_59, partial [Pseudomonadota bacterium]